MSQLDYLAQQVSMLKEELTIKRTALMEVSESSEQFPQPQVDRSVKKWMHNTAALVTAYIQHDWETCSILCAQYHKHMTVKRIVASMCR